MRLSPAADIPLRAKQRESKLAIINKASTPLDPMADYVINDAAGKFFPKSPATSWMYR